MKISLEWLREYLPGPLAAEAAADALTFGGFPVESAERHGDDTVIDVEVTSNRGDCLSHVGVARELAALLKDNREFREVRPAAREFTTPVSSATSVRIEAAALCPHYTARVIRGVTIRPSPAWLARRLEAVGLRPINNVVDVTNYVMFETGQPLHAFDFDRLVGQQIVVREARKGEPLNTIAGNALKLDAGMLVIADGERPVALAGVMGGKETEVTEATTNVLLESARFDPLSVRKTARALAMRSDSSYRFERGIDPLLPDRASLRAAQLILETAGGDPLAGAVEAGSTGHDPKTLTLRLEKLRRVLGVELGADAVVDALRRLRLSPVLRGDRVEVAVPSYRLDLNIEVDLVEEVARVIGYDAVPVRDEIAIRVTAPDPAAATLRDILTTLIGAGYYEAITFSFVSDALADNFLPETAAPEYPFCVVDRAVKKEDARLRPSLLPGLLEAVRRNETLGTPGARLFEIGSVFWNAPGGTAEERRRIGLVGGADLRDVRGVVETILSRLDPDKPVRVVPDVRAGFARGACGRIEWGGRVVGHLGKIDRAVAEKLSLRETAAAAELELPALIEGARSEPQLKPLPEFPAAERDLSFILPESARYAALEALVTEVKPDWLEALEYVTTYRGKPLEKGTKSVTIRLVFRSPAKTLTGEEVEASVRRVVEAATERLGATLRA